MCLSCQAGKLRLYGEDYQVFNVYHVVGNDENILVINEFACGTRKYTARC